MASIDETPKTNLTTTTEFNQVKAREIDFVTRFTKNWDSLREILNIMRPIRKAPGTKLTSYEATIKLESGDVLEGKEIPYSKATVKPVAYDDLDLKKWAKAVSIESVNQYGAAIAVQRTDEAFLNELQTEVLDDFYEFIKTGTLSMSENDFQMAIAMAIGSVVDKFKKMRRDVTNIVLFVNTLDAYRYLGAAEISVQTTNGLTYRRNFMGASTVILSSEIESGTVIATPADNIVLYYVDPGDGEFRQLGLDYTVQGETNLLGFHANGNYSTAVGESFAIMGMKLWAEYIDAIAVVTVKTGGDKMPQPATTGNLDAKYGTAFSSVSADTLVGGDYKVEPIVGNTYAATGTAKMKKKFTEFSKKADEQDGHFVPLLIPDDYAEKTKTYYLSDGTAKTTTDQGFIVRVDKYIAQKKRFTVDVEDGPTYTFDFSSLTLGESE